MATVSKNSAEVEWSCLCHWAGSTGTGALLKRVGLGRARYRWRMLRSWLEPDSSAFIVKSAPLETCLRMVPVRLNGPWPDVPGNLERFFWNPHHLSHESRKCNISFHLVGGGVISERKIYKQIFYIYIFNLLKILSNIALPFELLLQSPLLLL